MLLLRGGEALIDWYQPCQGALKLNGLFERETCRLLPPKCSKDQTCFRSQVV